jgi:mxaC protein
MAMSIDFVRPWLLLLLPLALLPLLKGGRDTLPFPSIAWLPADRLGRAAAFAWRAAGVVAIAALVLALAEPGQPGGQVARIGRGAEVLVLLDRSRSMDERMLPDDWRRIDPLVLRAQAGSRGKPKAQAARELLSQLVAQRADDRFALMFFSGGPILAVPFTQHEPVMQAGIRAGGIGRGLSNTDVGLALLAAIAEFAPRAVSGSRIILLVSDGGAFLDPSTQEAIAEGLARYRIGVNWIYLRAVNGPTLDDADSAIGSTPELALHRFFQSLPTPYHAYQADHPDDLRRAVHDLEQQQNLPLEYLEAVPRRDFSRAFVLLAALACAAALLYRTLALRSWR